MDPSKHFNTSAFDWFHKKHGRSPSSTLPSQVVGEGVASGTPEWVQPLVIGVLGLLSVILAVVVVKQKPEWAGQIGAFFARLSGRLMGMLGRHPPQDGQEQYELPQLPARPGSQRPLANRTDSDRLRRCSRV